MESVLIMESMLIMESKLIMESMLIIESYTKHFINRPCGFWFLSPFLAAVNDGIHIKYEHNVRNE